MAIALFHFHHLLSSKKVTALRALSKELGLRGVYKRGYPGLLFVSGDGVEEVRRFVKKVKAMRWQSCTLCGGGIREEHGVVGFGEGKGIEEVEAVRDVVRAAGGEEGWVKNGLGLGKGDGR
ncbi:hypothetical protein K440DRAFT_659736 [Wilcoxina mikolae CBS 423.85]|nr:hypothetical protein K440DRAFT_659736 [Wilcoxina mikolae CBS 423.85]